MKSREIEQETRISVIQRCKELNWWINRWNSQTKQQRYSFHHFHLSDKSKKKTKVIQKMIGDLNERMETKSDIQTYCLELKKKQKEMNDEWLKEEDYWFHEVLLNQQKSFKWRIDNFDDCKNCLNDNQKNLNDLIHDNQISIDSIFIYLFVFFLIFYDWFQSKIKSIET